MKTLPDIACSGASVEVVMELMAKQIEKRLQALEQGGKAAYVSEVEKQLASVIAGMSKLQPNITVAAATPSINVAAPAVTVMEKEGKSKDVFSMQFERGLSGQIESATIVKSKE